MISILDALRDPGLFGQLPRFRRLDTWGSWIVFLKAVFGLDLTSDERDLALRCTGRAELPAGGADEVAAIVGRRGGKTQIAAVVAVFLALFRDWRPHLSSGERAHVVVIAQSQKAARVLFGYVRGILRGVPALSLEVLAERTDEIDLRNGVTIGVWPSTFRATRGLTVCAAICDEVDFWWQESVNAAEEIIGALRPAMASLPGTKLVAISSPYTPTGWLHQFHRQHWGQTGTGALVWKAPSLTMNPTLSEAKIAAAIAEDPERGRAEWSAEWRAGASALFGAEQIGGLVRHDMPVVPPRDEMAYVGAVDPSGGGSDEFAWSIAHRDGDRVVVDLVAGRRRAVRGLFDLDGVVRECIADMRTYGVTRVQGDRYSGQWVANAFARQGFAYDYTVKAKSEHYLEILPLVTAGRLEIPDDPELIRQLRLLERRRGVQGKDTVDHPAGGHDDRANAMALAASGAAGGVPFFAIVGGAKITVTGDSVSVEESPERAVTEIGWQRDTDIGWGTNRPPRLADIDEGFARIREPWRR